MAAAVAYLGSLGMRMLENSHLDAFISPPESQAGYEGGKSDLCYKLKKNLPPVVGLGIAWLWASLNRDSERIPRS